MSNESQLLLARLRLAESDSSAPDMQATLTQAFASDNHRIVARAATLVGQRTLESFEDDLRAAYDRFLDDPVKTDPGCEAKTPLCEALRLIGHDDGDFFIDAIRYRQIEPGYGGDTDAAAQLRAICGFALIQLNDSRAMGELVDLLGDSEKTARAGAARAIAHARGQASELLLRLKIQMGDPEPEVLGECFAGLLRIDPDGGIKRVASFLTHRYEGVCCEAALALAETRSAAAFPHLKQQADQRHGRDYEGVLLTSIGLLGAAESVDYLLQVIAGPDEGAAIAAIRALRHCRDTRSYGERLFATLDGASNRRLDGVCAEEFPDLRRE